MKCRVHVLDQAHVRPRRLLPPRLDPAKALGLILTHSCFWRMLALVPLPWQGRRGSGLGTEHNRTCVRGWTYVFPTLPFCFDPPLGAGLKKNECSRTFGSSKCQEWSFPLGESGHRAERAVTGHLLLLAWKPLPWVCAPEPQLRGQQGICRRKVLILPTSDRWKRGGPWGYLLWAGPCITQSRGTMNSVLKQHFESHSVVGRLSPATGGWQIETLLTFRMRWCFSSFCQERTLHVVSPASCTASLQDVTCGVLNSAPAGGEGRALGCRKSSVVLKVKHLMLGLCGKWRTQLKLFQAMFLSTLHGSFGELPYAMLQIF